jgi:serine O-acetyltransferase
VLTIERIGRDGLRAYLLRQLEHHFPDGRDCSQPIDAHLDAALQRLRHCIARVRPWQPERFDVLHSTQTCQFLYYLANTIWRADGETEVPTKLFLLNKALNGIDCYYEIALPEVFYIGHSVGIVLAKATYGERLVLYQNSTVGKNRGIAPVIEQDVVLYPNTAVIGRSQVRAGSVVAQGVSVINRDTPGHCFVFTGPFGAGELAFKDVREPVIGDFFRD